MPGRIQNKVRPTYAIARRDAATRAHARLLVSSLRRLPSSPVLDRT